MPGYLDLEHLAERVSLGLIDTIIVCFPDMQGRLIGKRFHAEHFVRTGHAETHGCDYLLANDIEMEPVPGYKAASWHKGYGDFVMAPDLTTMIEVPWLEGTALVLCDIVDHHHHEPLAHSPRAILKRQLDRHAERNMRAFFASELEFYLFDETYASARE
jgi:glutamine synthetase